MSRGTHFFEKAFVDMLFGKEKHNPNIDTNDNNNLFFILGVLCLLCLWTYYYFGDTICLYLSAHGELRLMEQNERLNENSHIVSYKYSFVLYLVMQIIFFLPILYRINPARCRIPDDLIDGETNTFDFLRKSYSLLRKRYQVLDKGYSPYDYIMKACDIKFLRLIYLLHSKGYVVKVIDSEREGIEKENKREYLKPSISESLCKWLILLLKAMCIGFMLFVIDIPISFLLSGEGNELTVKYIVSMAIVFVAPFFICAGLLFLNEKRFLKNRKDVSDLCGFQNKFSGILDTFNKVGLSLLVEKISENSIETSKFNKEGIDKICEELENNPNRTYLRLKDV